MNASNFKSYPEYRDSGVPWLGAVPAHWDVRRLKTITKIVDKRSVKGDEVLLSMRKYHGLVPYHEHFNKPPQAATLVGFKIVQPGDVVLNRMQAGFGLIFASNHHGLVSPDFGVFQLNGEVHPRYLEEFCRSHDVRAEFHRESKGLGTGQSGFMRLYDDRFGAIHIAFPPSLHEQQILLKFVISISGKMNRLIGNRRRLIGALNEQKQAVINESFNLGLDPTTPVRASGIEMLGAIPKHWLVKPLKRWAVINKLVLPETTDPDYELSYIDIGAVGTGLLFEKPARIRFGSSPSRARRILRAGDTIISTVRTYLRAVLFICDEPKDLIASTGFAVLSPNPGVAPEALSLAVQSKTFVDSVTANSTGIGYPAIAETRLGSLHIALPPSMQEQDAIVERINRATSQLDASITRLQSEIELIREYRTRLISDVVTGKLDVRHLTLPPGDEKLSAIEEFDAVEPLEDELGNDEQREIFEDTSELGL